jgi:hypothetical protein
MSDDNCASLFKNEMDNTVEEMEKGFAGDDLLRGDFVQ